MRSPKPEEVRALREERGLTQLECARMVYITTRAWRQYELGERRMHASMWELFQEKAKT